MMDIDVMRATEPRWWSGMTTAEEAAWSRAHDAWMAARHRPCRQDMSNEEIEEWVDQQLLLPGMDSMTMLAMLIYDLEQTIKTDQETLAEYRAQLAVRLPLL